MLQVHRLVEAIEQALPAAQDDRGDRDRKLLEVSGAERLADDVRPTPDAHVLAACRLEGPGDRLVQPVYEGESALYGLVLRPVRDDEERYPERIVAAPRLRGLVHVAADDDGTGASHSPVEVLLVRPRRLAPGLLVVASRAAEDPVVQSLTAVAQPPAQPVVGTGDVPVQRDRDPRGHLRHRAPPWSSPAQLRPIWPSKLIG